MTRVRTEYSGNIARIRAVEDAIRATRHYTEGVSSLLARHPIQGTDFPSRVLCKYYEVYPDIEVTWDMPAGVAVDWLWGEFMSIDVVFRYDYRVNQASVIVKGGRESIDKLSRTIPGFADALAFTQQKHGRQVEPATRVATAPEATIRRA